jgi:hypothetical protein
MRTIQYILDTKTIESDTKWQTKDIPPKHYPIYKKSYPSRSGWIWRSLRLKSNTSEYVLTLRCNPVKDNWQAVLMVVSTSQSFAINRYEYHGSHPGTHVHSGCDNLDKTEMSDWIRIPNSADTHRRRDKNYTESSFYSECVKLFRIKVRIGEPVGDLLDGHS